MDKLGHQVRLLWHRNLLTGTPLVIRVQIAPFESETELGAFRSRHGDFGALASFAGYVRSEGEEVTALELQHYPGVTEAEIARFEEMALARFDLIDCLIIHRVGRILPGEAIVLVAALAGHRKPALGAVDFLMDYLKTDAPFWKRQSGLKGSEWIEPRTDDHLARAAWENEKEQG
ncbi:MAG: molybdenum cofactor biosynthesis protein MoaE [Hyphomonadaceae bacterium]|nr:molybdenum cofactor biosynthesis protein MoaE [Hyphomonadaceae bacterium]